MMETLFELRSANTCRLFDFFEEAKTAMDELIASGKFSSEDLFIERVVTE